MPVYEYLCQDCRELTSVFVSAYEAPTGLTCSACGGANLHKIISGFSYHRSEADRLAEFDAGGMRDESFYQDDRNVGLWARKRVRDLGADAETVKAVDEVVEKTREKTKDILKSDTPLSP